MSVNTNSTNATCNSNKKWNTCQFKSKSYHECKKDYSLNPSTCICENSKHLNSISDTSVTECDEVIIFMGNELTKNTNTIATVSIFFSIMSTVSIIFHSKKVRDCHILHTVCSVTILLVKTYRATQDTFLSNKRIWIRNFYIPFFFTFLWLKKVPWIALFTTTL